MIKLNNKSNIKRVFRKSPKKKRYKIASLDGKLLIEALIMLFVSINLIIFLNSIPKKLVWNEFLNQTWINFSQGLVQLFDSLIQISAAISVLVLLFVTLFLLLGGTLRIFRLLSRSIIKKDLVRKKNIFIKR